MRPFELKTLDHLVLRTGQLETMIAFYGDVLGCAVERRLADEIGLVQLRAGAALIDLVTLDGSIGRRLAGPKPGVARAGGRGGHNVDHFCLTIDRFDDEALRAHLAKHGVTATPTAQLYGAEGVGPSVYIEDPDGNTVELKGPG